MIPPLRTSGFRWFRTGSETTEWGWFGGSLPFRGEPPEPHHAPRRRKASRGNHSSSPPAKGSNPERRLLQC